MSAGDSDVHQTILSAIQSHASAEAFSQHSPHLFCADPDAIVTQLKELIDSTIHISGSLNAHLTLPLSNPKLYSLLRQETAITNTVHNAAQTVRQTVTALRKRAGILYGEAIPLERSEIFDWFTSRVLAWGKSAGMEAFKDEESDGRTTIVLGGKVIVIDMSITVNRSENQNPSFNITNVKTSFAVPNGTSTPPSSGSTSLDGFLTEILSDFISEILQTPEDQDPERAARIGARVTDHLKYLMTMDQLALKDGEAGLMWFNGCDILSQGAERFAASECDVVSKDLSSSPAPLDIFLLRGHALPLPYLTTPSLSFLVHVSSQAYLTMLRTPTSPESIIPPSLPQIDVPFSCLRSYAGAHPRKPGVAVASLVLCQGGPRVPQQPGDIPMDSLASRPTFPLAPFPADIAQPFPVANFAGSLNASDGRYFLDFTDDGRYPGIIMAQTRMRDIEMVIHPLAGIDPMNNVQPVVEFASGSWLDMLLNPGSNASYERYVSLYVSPTSLHPPLRLKLASPEEPGFRLEKVPVRNMKEALAILEVVREQCWINETLLACQWAPETANTTLIPPDTAEEDATEDELNAVLGGSIAPKSIPVTVTIHSALPRDDIFDAATPTPGQSAPHRTTKIVMTSPEQPPISGLVEITVAHDSSRPRGIALNINGALGADVNVEVLEEVCRRGGLLGLPGRVWTKAHKLS